MAKKQGNWKYKSSIVRLDRETYSAAQEVHATTPRDYTFQNTLELLIKEAIATRREAAGKMADRILT